MPIRPTSSSCGQSQQKLCNASSYHRVKDNILDLAAPQPLACAALQNFVIRLSQSALFKDMFDHVRALGWDMQLGDAMDEEYQFCDHSQMVTIDDQGIGAQTLQRSSFFQSHIMLSLMKAVRDIWHEEQTSGAEQDYNLESIILTERLRAADCDIFALSVCWQLHEAGLQNLWRHVIASNLGDCALKYQRHMESFGAQATQQSAMRAAFKQWFMEEQRLNRCDHGVLNYLDQCLNDPAMRWGQQNPAHSALEDLSTLPCGRKYLQNIGADLLSDPIYHAMTDLANKEHLNQIRAESETVTIGNLTFSDLSLAQKLFPQTISN